MHISFNVVHSPCDIATVTHSTSLNPGELHSTDRGRSHLATAAI